MKHDTEYYDMDHQRLFEFVGSPRSSGRRRGCVLAYAKGTMDNLTREQENELRKLTRELAREDC
jgi:hypothetical protein